MIVDVTDLILGRMASKVAKVLLGGNGASAAIASHAAVDLTKQAGVRSLTLFDPPLITAFSNDYGYERWLQKALGFYMDSQDVIILISSSGKSKNIVNAGNFVKEKGNKLITFSFVLVFYS